MNLVQPYQPVVIERSAKIVKNVVKIVVQPYNEQDGTGHLRYIAINVERKTSKVQLTLVWNSEPYGYIDNNDNKDDVGQCLLNELVNELINKYGTVKGGNKSEHKSSLRLHSLWVHFNAQWKHANSIFQYNNDFSSPQTIISDIFVVDPTSATSLAPRMGCKWPLSLCLMVFAV